MAGSLAAALLPWTLWLLRSLPARHATPHWNIAWAGFDLLLAAALATTALAAWRRSPWLQGSVVATGTLLLADSWFDLATARPGGELVTALAEAVLAELPLAALCFRVAATAAGRAGQHAERAGEKT